MTEITSLSNTNIIEGEKYSAEIVIDEVKEISEKAPLQVMCRFEKTGNKLQGKVWDHAMKPILESYVGNNVVYSVVLKCKSSKAPGYGLETFIESFNSTERTSILSKPETIKDYVNIERCKTAILNAVEKVSNQNYKSIINKLLVDDFWIWQAAKVNHHAFEGGLAFHTYGVLQKAAYNAKSYIGKLNNDLIITGAILHDIGKLKTYKPTGDVNNYENLIGHIAAGVEMIDDACSELGIDKYGQDIVDLKHCILSHHNTLEFGSPVTPILPEAYIIGLADYADAKLETVGENIIKLDDDESSNPIIALDGGRVYRRGK